MRASQARAAHQVDGMVPVSALRASIIRLAVRSSCTAEGSVPFRPRPGSQSVEMPPTGAVLVTYVAGEVNT
jgi:hypothetical protein